MRLKRRENLRPAIILILISSASTARRIKREASNLPSEKVVSKDLFFNLNFAACFSSERQTENLPGNVWLSKVPLNPFADHLFCDRRTPNVETFIFRDSEDVNPEHADCQTSPHDFYFR
jgi:hypothetical protein